MQLKLGMLVRLKSGGPVMVISKYSAHRKIPSHTDTVTVDWMNNGELKSKVLPLGVLEPTERVELDGVYLFDYVNPANEPVGYYQCTNFNYKNCQSYLTIKENQTACLGQGFVTTV
jgi:uncharacterized protein YodC (DUF2158 family)